MDWEGNGKVMHVALSKGGNGEAKSRKIGEPKTNATGGTGGGEKEEDISPDQSRNY